MSDSPPITRSTLTVPEPILREWASKSRKILVRSEYEETEEAANSAHDQGKDAFVVAGQPGIGKSIFLLYLLACRLALGLPTALQTREDYAVLFHEGGVSQLSNLSRPSAYEPMAPSFADFREWIWALVDLGPFLPEPADIFKRPGTFFVVTATCSDLGHFKWLGKVFHKYFYMNLWSLSEILQAHPFIGIRGSYTEQQLWELYVKFGASPGSLALYASAPDTYESLVTRQIMGARSDDLRCASCDPEAPFHHIFVTWPLPDRRDISQQTIVSRYVFELLWENHLQHQMSDVEYFYYKFLDSPATADLAGWIFESRVHQLLRKQQIIQVFPITQDGPRPKKVTPKDRSGRKLMEFQLPKSNERPFVKGEPPEDGYYRLEFATNHPAVDSLLVFHSNRKSPPTFLLFRIIRNTREHIISKDTLDSIKELGLPNGAHKFYVVVTPEGVKPEIKVPKADPSKGGQSGEFPVFNYPVPTNVLFSRN